MKQKFVIEGRLDGLNELILACRTNQYVGAKLKKKNQGIVEAYIRASRLKPMNCPVYIKTLYVEPSRKRDKDNIASCKKFIWDALVSAGIIENDTWNCIEGYEDHFDVDKSNPRIEVEIEER